MELHIVFNYSAAGTLRQVMAGRREAKVVRFSDNLSYGPIDLPDTARRRAWVDENLGFDNPDIVADEEQFWPQIFGKVGARIAWVSRRSAAEYCGFLEYLRRLGDLPTRVVDVTDATDEWEEHFCGTGDIPAAYLNDLLDSSRLLNAADRTAYNLMWQELQAQNGNLRVVDPGFSLQSAPETFYDDRLLAMTGPEWCPMARVMGCIMAETPVDENFLRARLGVLVEAGFLMEQENGRVLPDIRRVTA